MKNERGDGGSGLEVVFGKAPKEMRDSDYARYVGGVRYSLGSEGSIFGLNYAQTRDTGTELQGSEKVKNRVVSMDGESSFRGGWDLKWEYAFGNAWGWGIANSKRGKARYLKANYKKKKTRLTLLYEGAGSDFVSETAYFTPDRTEFSALYQRKPNADLMYILGYKNRLHRGDRTYFYPTVLTLQPLKNRTGLRLTLEREFQRTIGRHSNIVDERTIQTSMNFKNLNTETYFSRRKNKDNDGAVLYRNTKNLRLRYPFSDKFNTIVQFTREMRQGSTSPLMRQFRTIINYELKAWTDLILSMERYYNATDSDNTKLSFGFRKVNVYDDWEVGCDFQFANYSDHNDKLLKLKYFFLR